MTRVGGGRNVYRVLMGNPEVKKKLEKPRLRDIGSRIILKRILQK